MNNKFWTILKQDFNWLGNISNQTEKHYLGFSECLVALEKLKEQSIEEGYKIEGEKTEFVEAFSAWHENDKLPSYFVSVKEQIFE